jgi:hypothetical protein
MKLDDLTGKRQAKPETTVRAFGHPTTLDKGIEDFGQ